jgi:hypothetical protein
MHPNGNSLKTLKTCQIWAVFDENGAEIGEN